MSPIKRLLLIIALTACWSPSFLFIKLAIEELPPMTIVMCRVTLAVVVLGLILLWNRRALPTAPMFWVHSMIMSLFASILPFCFFCYAEQTIESALAAIINGISPMFTALIAHLCISNDRLTPQKVIGIVLSAAGLLLLFAPNILEGLSGTTLGILAATSAAFCYAVSHVYGKRFTTGHLPFVMPTAQLLCASIVLIPLAFYYENPLTLQMPSYKAILAICGMSALGTITAFIIYYKLLDHCGPTAISMVACFFPVGGMVLGFLFLDESMTWGALGASMLILAGLAIVNELIDLRPVLARLSPVQNEAEAP
jgi:drug/metabolite transporter (DMT)-like permease